MSPTKHTNTPSCTRCNQILDKYPGFHAQLREWFNTFRSSCPEAHISWAGRGKADQELFYNRKLSRAHYGQSAHNWNAALDFFRLTQAGGASFDSAWYREELGPKVMADPTLTWYGAPGAAFPELPHVQWKAWVQNAESGLLTLVDGPAQYPLPTQS